MTVGIVGLGLIGGSFAKAYHEAGHRVLAFDTDQSVFDFAVLSGAVDGPLIGGKPLLLRPDPDRRAIPPPPWTICGSTARTSARSRWSSTAAAPSGWSATACFPLAKEYGFTYLGGHPMAGTHNSGFKYATPTMFHNAPMVLVPADHNDIDLLSRVKELLAPAGFGRFSITTAEQHDEMIAFTSQLAHVVSNAYIKSPTAGLHKGFSAGSYKDMTRVAWLAPEMWAELFLENKDFLMAELDTLMANLRQYQDAMVHNDLPGLVRLLDEGRKRKEEVDGR